MTTRSELIRKLAINNYNIKAKVMKYAVEYMIVTISAGERIEIRGFGSFFIHYRAPSIL